MHKKDVSSTMTKCILDRVESMILVMMSIGTLNINIGIIMVPPQMMGIDMMPNLQNIERYPARKERQTWKKERSLQNLTNPKLVRH